MQKDHENETRTYPLEGIRVLELGTHVAVPSSTRLLADFGAEVIKIEGVSGDPYRTFGDQYGTPIEENYNPFFTFHNTNKKLIAVNLKDPKGKEIFDRLLEKTDVFVSSVRLAGLQRMGIDYETIRQRFPRLIYYHFSGLGTNGPDASRPGFDSAAFWARSGGLVDIVPEGAFPPHPSQAMGDMCSGAMIAYGILTALWGRERTGRGTFLSSSLYSSAVYYMAAGIISAQKKFGKKFPQDPLLPENPFRHNYLCKDGEWIMMATQSYNKRWHDLCRIFGLYDWEGQEKYQTEEAARKAGVVPEMVMRLNEIFKTRTVDEWADIFLKEDIAYEKLRHFKDVETDQQAWDNGYLTYVEFPGNSNIVMPNSPVQMDEYMKNRICPQSGVGADTESILDELGYSKEFIMEYKKRKFWGNSSRTLNEYCESS